MTYTEPAGLYALCKIFNIEYQSGLDLDGGWVHSLWTLDKETGYLLRQVTIKGLNSDAWRAAIEQLLSAQPQSVW